MKEFMNRSKQRLLQLYVQTIANSAATCDIPLVVRIGSVGPVDFGLDKEATHWTDGFKDDVYVLNAGRLSFDYVCTDEVECQRCRNGALVPKKSTTFCTMDFTYTDRFANPMDTTGNIEFETNDDIRKKRKQCFDDCNYKHRMFSKGGGLRRCIEDCDRKYPETDPYGTPYALIAHWVDTFSISKSFPACTSGPRPKK